MSKSISILWSYPVKPAAGTEAGYVSMPRLRPAAKVTVREMSERIQRTCTVTRADGGSAHGVGRCDCGRRWVQADCASGGFGHVSDWCERQGPIREDKYDVSMINKARINFRPGLALSGMLTALSFSKVDKLPKKEKKPEEEVSV